MNAKKTAVVEVGGFLRLGAGGMFSRGYAKPFRLNFPLQVTVQHLLSILLIAPSPHFSYSVSYRDAIAGELEQVDFDQ